MSSHPPSSRRANRDRAVEHVRNCVDMVPATAIILGSGLGGLADKIEDAVRVPFAEIPGFVASTAGGHLGQLVLGTLAGQPVVAMAGRLHRYEGWSHSQVTFPVEVMAALGASVLIVSNAAGGLNPRFRVGDIVVIRDHLDLMGGSIADGTAAAGLLRSSLAGRAEDDCLRESLHRRAEVYDSALAAIAMEAAIKAGFQAYPGTYLATLGPNYETRSEYRMMRRIGADLAGMSTVPEAMAAASEGMRVLGLSMVSNVANPDRPVPADHAEVLEAGRAAEVKMEAIVRETLSSLANR